MDKMTYVFDIDGTICTDTHGEYNKSVPLSERISKINKLYEDGHIILIQTARGMGRTNNSQKEAIDALFDFTEEQLERWGVKYHRLFLGKPAGDFYIDDKAIRDKDFFK